jgi:hypothetical protein
MEATLVTYEDLLALPNALAHPKHALEDLQKALSRRGRLRGGSRSRVGPGRGS